MEIFPPTKNSFSVILHMNHTEISPLPNSSILDHKNRPNHQIKSPDPRSVKQMLTLICDIDSYGCLRSVIINTTDYSLFGKTAVFLLRILKCKMQDAALLQTCRMFGTYTYHCVTNI